MKGKKESTTTGSAVDRIVYSEWGSPLDPQTGDPLQDRLPSQQKLTVQRDRKGRGGKTVTLITGFQLTPASLDKLAKQLKAHCGSGGTAKETSIEIQGDHRDRVGEILKTLGYGVKFSGG